MNKYYIKGPKVYSETGIIDNACVHVADGLINAIDASDDSSQCYEYPESYHLVPGFIDLHIHGANGFDVMDASKDALAGISAALLKEGVTSFLATTMTSDISAIERAMNACKNFIASKSKGATMLGLHLEGPFISTKKTGAQNAKNIIAPDIDKFKELQTASGNNIKIVTLAPECQNSEALIDYLQQQKIIASIGHSDATFAEAKDAFAKGANYTTHLFNAMRGIHHREPGCVTAALLDDNVWVEIIADGKHLHPEIINLILKLKGIDKTILITDAMRAKCMQDGVYDLGGQDVTVKNNTATLSDGTLAGSLLKIPDALKNIIKYTKLDLSNAVKMVTENPAKALGVFDRIGSIKVGKNADLVVLDEKFNVVEVFQYKGLSFPRRRTTVRRIGIINTHPPFL